jgi:hypothetical protein
MANRHNDCIMLIEEVPGVEEEHRWFIFEHRPAGKGRGKLWFGPSREAGEQWAKDNGETIDFVEVFEP